MASSAVWRHTVPDFGTFALGFFDILSPPSISVTIDCKKAPPLASLVGEHTSAEPFSPVAMISTAKLQATGRTRAEETNHGTKSALFQNALETCNPKIQAVTP